MQSGNLVAGVVLRIRQLWLPVEQLRLTGRPLIDSWKQINQVYTRCTGRGEMNDDVPMAVESANVSHVSVVVRGDVDVVVFRPADAFDVNGNRRSHRARRWSHAGNTGLDDEVGKCNRLVAVVQRQAVQAAKIVWSHYRRFDAAVASDHDLAKARFQRLESVAAYAAADECLPHQLEHVIGRKALALQMDVHSNRTLGWRKAELRGRDLHLRHWYGLRRVRFDVSGGRVGSSRRRVKDEIRPWQIGVRRLLIVQITLRLITGIDFYRVITNRSCGAEPCDCGAVRTR